MPVKYSCPKCGRRFAEWGAEKFGFKCPGDEWCPADRPDVIELVRVGMQEDAKPAKKPTLKRPMKRAAAVSSMDDDELLVPDIEDIESESDVEDDVEEIEEEDEEVVAVSDDAEETASESEGGADALEDDADSDDFDGDDSDVDDTLEDADDIVEEDWKG